MKKLHFNAWRHRAHSRAAGRRRTEAGQVLVMTVVLMPALIILLGLVADGGRYLNAEQAADTAAEQAARTGASSVDLAALHAGQVSIDPATASEAAANYWASTGLPGVPNVTVNGDTVSVQVSYSMPTELLSMIGISTMGVHVNQSATALAGVSGVINPTGG